MEGSETGYELPGLPAGWSALAPELRTARFAELRGYLRADGAKHEIYPPAPEVFRALELTPLDRVRVLLLGQDPYHGAGQAHGLAFSVRDGVKPPASLRNIFKELSCDVGPARSAHGSLEGWAEQGVLLLNAVLTVRAGEANSHRGRGWEEFTDAVIRLVSEHRSRMVFVLWGAYAQRKLPLIDSARHAVITTAHPSPLAAHRGFFGSRPFSRINEELVSNGDAPIDWLV